MPFGSRPGLLRQGVLELVAPADSAFDRISQRFCANSLNLSNLHHLVNFNLPLRPRPLKLNVGGTFLACESRLADREMPVQNLRAAHHLKDRPASNAGADRARRELNSRVMQWLVLCGIPYRGSGALASPDPANQPPSSHLGQATRPPGGSTAHLQLPKSSTRYPCLQAAHGQAVFASVQLPENNNPPV